MKVLIYFSGDISEPKGTPIRVKNNVLHLIKNGAEVYYAGRILPTDISFSGSLLVGKPLLRPFLLSSFVRKNKIDIVYIQTSAGLWLTPFLRLFTCTKIGCDFHSLRIEEEKIYNNLNWFSYIFQKYLEYFLCMHLHFATGVSAPLGQYYKKFIRKYYLFPVGVDLSIFNRNVIPNKILSDWKGKSLLIGYAGNTKWYQGLHTVLQALVKLKKEGNNLFKLVIVASSLDPKIEEFIKKNNLSQSVYILSKQPHNKVPSLLMSADILTIVRPSNMITEYAFPSKLPEHLALGKAIVVSGVGDVGSYVSNGISGLVISPGNVEELSSALTKLIDFKLREKLGIGAWNLAKDRFEINALNDDLYVFLITQMK